MSRIARAALLALAIAAASCSRETPAGLTAPDALLNTGYPTWNGRSLTDTTEVPPGSEPQAVTGFAGSLGDLETPESEPGTVPQESSSTQ